MKICGRGLLDTRKLSDEGVSEESGVVENENVAKGF